MPRASRLFFVVLLIAVGYGAVANAQQWKSLTTPADRVFTFVRHDNRLFAGTENTGLWVSNDDGHSWQTLRTTLFEMSYDVSSFVSSGTNLFVGMEGSGVYRSTDGGTTWQTFNQGFRTQSFVAGMQQVGDELFVAVESNLGLQAGGIYKTSIHNAEWAHFGTGLPASIPQIGAFVKTPSNTFILASSSSTQRGNSYVSTDLGATWQDRRIADAQIVSSLEVVGNTIFAGTNNGVYYSADLGKHWEVYGLQGKFVDKVISFQGLIYAAVDGMGVLVTDSGNWWLSLSGNLPIEDDFVSALFAHENRFYVSLSANKGLWAYSPQTVGIQTPTSQNGGLRLGQNYPNPIISEVTTIPLYLRESTKISLAIVDVLGSEVRKAITEQHFPAGNSSLPLNTEGLPPGQYFYRLQSSSGVTEVRAMMKK